MSASITCLTKSKNHSCRAPLLPEEEPDSRFFLSVPLIPIHRDEGELLAVDEVFLMPVADGEGVVKAEIEVPGGLLQDAVVPLGVDDGKGGILRPEQGGLVADVVPAQVHRKNIL